MFIDSSNIPLNRQQHKKVVRIIHNLLNLPESIPFRKPVCYRALGLDDYKKVVKKPIDLNMIRRANNEWKYKFVEQVFDDIQLCWNNCRAYNKPQSEIYEAAVIMENHFVDQLIQQYPDYIIPQGIIKGRQKQRQKQKEKQPLKDKQKEKQKIKQNFDKQKQISISRIQSVRYQSQSITNLASSQKLQFKQPNRQRRGQSKQIRQIREQRQRQRLAKQQKQRQARQARQIRQKQRQLRLAKEARQREIKQNELKSLSLEGISQTHNFKQQTINLNEQIINAQVTQSQGQKRKSKKQLKVQKSQRKQQQKNSELIQKEQQRVQSNQIHENKQNQLNQNNQINQIQVSRENQQKKQMEIQKSTYEKINQITHQLKKISDLKVLREVVQIIIEFEPGMINSKDHRHKIIASQLKPQTINQIANLLSKFDHK